MFFKVNYLSRIDKRQNEHPIPWIERDQAKKNKNKSKVGTSC